MAPPEMGLTVRALLAWMTLTASALAQGAPPPMAAAPDAGEEPAKAPAEVPKPKMPAANAHGGTHGAHATKAKASKPKPKAKPKLAAKPKPKKPVAHKAKPKKPVAHKPKPKKPVAHKTAAVKPPPAPKAKKPVPHAKPVTAAHGT